MAKYATPCPLLLAGLLTLTGPVIAGDPAAGEETYRAKGCFGCHGKDGIAPVDERYPSLANRDSNFIRQQLNGFRRGVQHKPIMNAMATLLNDSDVEDLAAYLGAKNKSTLTSNLSQTNIAPGDQAN